MDHPGSEFFPQLLPEASPQLTAKDPSKDAAVPEPVVIKPVDRPLALSQTKPDEGGREYVSLKNAGELNWCVVAVKFVVEMFYR